METGRLRFLDHGSLRNLHFDWRADGKGVFLEVDVDQPSSRFQGARQKGVIRLAVGDVVECIADKDKVK